MEPKSLNLDFLCVSETKLLGSDNLKFDDYVLVWFGKETEHQSGMAILRKKKITIYIYIYILYIYVCIHT